MQLNLELSQQIILRAQQEFNPSLRVALVSGGTDSFTLYYVLKELKIPLDAVIHINTGTGIPETEEFMTAWGASIPEPYLVGSAGDAFEKYVLRKGFFGRGLTAHTYAYHYLKAGPLRKVISSLRKRRRRFSVVMYTGIRLDESKNRQYVFGKQTFKRDPAAPNNIFVNAIEHWTRDECRELLKSVNAPVNPVARALHRSGECMCGTMQSLEDRAVASVFYPHWGAWIDALESRVKNEFPWGWGENVPKGYKRACEDPILCRHCEVHI
jgi:3'-phosphoadenosine 5'-phosphosulfate sulfotransferase (PAPS reductase)/FAD synthetase